MQYDSQYCWRHEDQQDLSLKYHARELNWLEPIHKAISASYSVFYFCRPRIFLLLGFLASLWLIGSILEPDFSAPEYLGPVHVCNNPELSLDIFDHHRSYMGRFGIPRWSIPFKQTQIDAVFEPASLVDHAINVTIPAAGAGAQRLTVPQVRGLSMWQKCSKEEISSDFDLQCPFDAFNQLFFGGHLAPVKIGWTEPTTTKPVIYGTTHHNKTLDSPQRFVNITILSQESHRWHEPGSFNVHGVLLHEMVHAYFALYACSDARVYAPNISGVPNISGMYPFLSNLGATGHGPEWLRLTRALEKAAGEYLGLGELELGWKYSVKKDLANVKLLRDDLAEAICFTDDEVDLRRKVLSDLDGLLGLEA